MVAALEQSRWVLATFFRFSFSRALHCPQAEISCKHSETHNRKHVTSQRKSKDVNQDVQGLEQNARLSIHICEEKFTS